MNLSNPLEVASTIHIVNNLAISGVFCIVVSLILSEIFSHWRPMPHERRKRIKQYGIAATTISLGLGMTLLLIAGGLSIFWWN